MCRMSRSLDRSASVTVKKKTPPSTCARRYRVIATRPYHACRRARTRGHGARSRAPLPTLLAGLAIPQLDRLELAADGEIVVVEQQRARDAVLVELELDRIDRRLVAGIGRLVEIAHRHRPAPQRRERILAGGGIGGQPLIRRDRVADD